MRHLLAFLLATLAAALAPSACFAVWFFAVGGTSGLPALPLLFLAAGVIALLHAAVLGLPIAACLLKLGRFQLLPMTLAGAAIGGIPALLWRVSNMDPAQLPVADHAAFGAVAAGLGAVGSAAFFFTYRSMRPYNSFKPTPSARPNQGVSHS
jgi:hypothetical protein